MDIERLSSAVKHRPGSKPATEQSHSSPVSTDSAVPLDQDVISLTIPESAQKIVHCLIGEDLFVDKAWCIVKKKDLLEDIAIENANSPFTPLTAKIMEYKPDEFLIGYEPFATEPNQFMLCITEAGRAQVLNKLEEMKSTYLQRIQQSKAVKPKMWESLGSEEFVNQFQIKHTRKSISLEWIGDISKRCKHPKFEDCDPDDMKNGYTCLVPSEKEKYELVNRKTQETGIQAIASKTEAEVQTDPEIPTNASTQYAPETEIAIVDTAKARASVASHNLDGFFQKYKDYLEQCLGYNEVYDLYHDDYPALYVQGGETQTQVQQQGLYHQYQSFTDVAAIEGKLVVSSSWHPNYTGIVAIAYANEIPCLMKELELDSDQTDYEDEKTDEEGEAGEEPELGAGARDWLLEERKEKESTVEDTELYDQAMRRLKDIEATKLVWNAKIQEGTEELRGLKDETPESGLFSKSLHYKEYQPEPEQSAGEGEKIEGSATSQISETEEGERRGTEGGDMQESLQAEAGVSPSSSRISLRQQLEADVDEFQELLAEPSASNMADVMSGQDSGSHVTTSARTGTATTQPSPSFVHSPSTNRSIHSAHKMTHHRKKHKKLAAIGKSTSRGIESMTSKSSMDSSSMESRIVDTGKEKYLFKEPEFFDEVTDEGEIREKQEELPLLEVNNPVLIWSFVDDLTPKLRLDSPYEVGCVAFSKHNGNLVAGGTASGQVVIWDITGRIQELEKPERLSQDQLMFRKRMEDLMSWRRDIHSKRRVRFTAISNQKYSHLEKITDLAWITPTFLVNDSLEIIKNPSTEYSLQVATCSVYGNFLVWDLKTEPAKEDYRRAPQIFKTKERFGRPPTLDTGLSLLHKLHRIWKPTCKMSIMYKNLPVLLMGFNTAAAMTGKYIRVSPKQPGVKEVMEDRIEYRAVFPEIEDIPLSMYISNLFGQAGTLVWDTKSINSPANVDKAVNVYHYWESYHDRPITRLCKHPFIPSVCLTIGGHVWAVWHIDNKEEPILVKRYYGAYVTDGGWSSLRPSLIRIARSDGVVEIWDLLVQNHAPAATIVVSGRVITNISSPLLPEARGLLGVADYNSAFCLFYIPQQFRVWSDSELTRLTKFINREPERKRKMKEWSKWWKENNVNTDREERKQMEEKKKLDEEVRLEKEKQDVARKKYNKEAYKWYMRRRGRSFLLPDEADDRWREKQEEHMQQLVMAKKKIDRSEMELLMRPIVREEKNEALKHAKAQEKLTKADQLFKQTVEMIFPKPSKKVEEKSDEAKELKEHVTKMVEHYFGETFDQQADEVADYVEKHPWQFEFEWAEVLEKYNTLRMLFNDRRRKRNKALRWLRKKVREQLSKEGRKVHVRKSHRARYPKRKIQRRKENFEWLQQTYGDDYNIYWDKFGPCRKFTDRKFRYTLLEDIDSLFLGQLSEPDVEDEEILHILDEGKVMSSLEMITQVGIEQIPEETFCADLDTALLTLESRFSLGVKIVPSLIHKKVSQPSTSRPGHSTGLVKSTSRLTVLGAQSPQCDSDVSMETEAFDETALVDNQLQELDNIQQSMDTTRNKKIDSQETSEEMIKFEDSISENISVERRSSMEIETRTDDDRLSKVESSQGGGEEEQEGEEEVKKEEGKYIGKEEVEKETVDELDTPDTEV